MDGLRIKKILESDQYASKSYRFIPDSYAKDILFLSLILFERKYEKAF